jgi:hypothetical protein
MVLLRVRLDHSHRISSHTWLVARRCTAQHIAERRPVPIAGTTQPAPVAKEANVWYNRGELVLSANKEEQT